MALDTTASPRSGIADSADDPIPSLDLHKTVNVIVLIFTKFVIIIIVIIIVVSNIVIVAINVIRVIGSGVGGGGGVDGRRRCCAMELRLKALKETNRLVSSYVTFYTTLSAPTRTIDYDTGCRRNS